MRRARSLILSSLAVAASAATAAAPSPELPPFSWAYQPVGVDERGLWMEADEFERQLRDSRLLVRDEPLNNYVRGVLCRAVGEDRCKGVRLYIVRDPSINASMLANGAMQVHTGLFLHVRSEAELAAVVAHEFGHFELRHQLAAFKRRRGATDLMIWNGITGSSARTQRTIVGSVFRFERTEETEADIRSFQYLAASPYRAAASPDIWERMMALQDASAAARQVKSNSDRLPSFFDTHPSNMQRMTYLKALAAEHGNGGEDGAESYAKALAPWRQQFLADQIKLNDFGASEYVLAQLARSGWTPELLVARGDLYRQRGNPRDLVVAAQSYRDAIAQGASDPVVRRDLGMVLLRSGARADAAAALQQYLVLRPDASDKALVAMLIDQAGPTPATTPVVMNAQADNTLTAPGRAVTVAHSALTVTPDREWSRISTSQAVHEQWTIDGLQLNDIDFYAGIPAGESLFGKVPKELEPVPRFDATTLITDIPALYENSYRLLAHLNVIKTDQIEPAKFAGHPGVRFTYEYTPSDRVRRKGEGYAAIIDGKLYMITFEAPALHFFDAGITSVREMVATATIAAQKQ